MMPVLRRISEYHGTKSKHQDEAYAPVPVNLQDTFEPVTGDEFVFGGSIVSAQEGAGADGSETLSEEVLCH